MTVILSLKQKLFTHFFHGVISTMKSLTTVILDFKQMILPISFITE